ncbi:uncharacterized protein LY89DRAFT_101906 [Mollisia scopiformis]|uniref:Uncharacterized protein n=1 Tax=Mollisia scopiformis TaxID=149040 RepID=A0A194X790_MOLSC|nr:uncharacterized protein LY89DRAFT_101906 [Mollisia scopiformis]KUJ16040.1 hypothetical protein LY89DRAFT_101906 [Mollisia scopiformis]
MPQHCNTCSHRCRCSPYNSTLHFLLYDNNPEMERYCYDDPDWPSTDSDRIFFFVLVILKILKLICAVVILVQKEIEEDERRSNVETRYEYLLEDLGRVERRRKKKKNKPESGKTKSVQKNDIVDRGIKRRPIGILKTRKRMRKIKVESWMQRCRSQQDHVTKRL